MIKPKKIIISLLATTFISSCTMIPAYKKPELPVASELHGDISLPESAEKDAGSITWKQFFKSKSLQNILQVTLDNNRDLRIAALNIKAAQALYRIEKSDIVPNLNVGGSALRSKITESQSTTGSGYISSTYNANIATTAFELDLFGKLRSQNNAALEEFLASKENKNAVQILLIAQTADAYLQWLSDRKILKLVEETLSTQQKSYNLIEKSYENGVASRLDLAQVRTALETARVNKALFTRKVRQDKNALILLMGVKNSNILNEKQVLNDIEIKNSIPANLSSEVLLLRPDIKKAEHILKSTNADIGAARAAFFPSISLISSVGFASNSLSDLFKSSASGAWAFAPQISLPIFTGGANTANLKYSKIQKEIAVADYEKAIQTAFKEVSDELIAKQTLKDELKAQHQLVMATKETYDLSYARYTKGIDSFLNVLDAQRSLFTAQQNEVEVEKLLLSNRVNLYKALGGGAE
jgi:outer membrane protein, multidrug efflux system